MRALGVCRSAAEQGSEKRPAGDHRDDQPRRCEQADLADHGGRGRSERGHGISRRGAGWDDGGQYRVVVARRIQPRIVSAGTPRSSPIVRWRWPKALARSACPTTSITKPRCAGARAGSTTWVIRQATGAADPSRPWRNAPTTRGLQRTGPGEAPASQLARAARTPQRQACNIRLRLRFGAGATIRAGSFSHRVILATAPAAGKGQVVLKPGPRTCLSLDPPMSMAR